MQYRMRDVKFTEVQKTLSGMGRLETLVLEIDYHVSLRWYNIVVTNHTYHILFMYVCTIIIIIIGIYYCNCSTMS